MTRLLRSRTFAFGYLLICINWIANKSLWVCGLSVLRRLPLGGGRDVEDSSRIGWRGAWRFPVSKAERGSSWGDLGSSMVVQEDGGAMPSLVDDFSESFLSGEGAEDILYMRFALELALMKAGSTRPNPTVGCVVVDSSRKVVGAGAHEYAGGAHAEIIALQQAGEKAENATVYVTLEPCSHYGRTPPCCLSLIEKKIRRVVYAQSDPNPVVMGGGLRRLQSHGIQVSKCTHFSQKAPFVNLPFFHRVALLANEHTSGKENNRRQNTGRENSGRENSGRGKSFTRRSRENRYDILAPFGLLNIIPCVEESFSGNLAHTGNAEKEREVTLCYESYPTSYTFKASPSFPQPTNHNKQEIKQVLNRHVDVVVMEYGEFSDLFSPCEISGRMREGTALVTAIRFSNFSEITHFRKSLQKCRHSHILHPSTSQAFTNSPSDMVSPSNILSPLNMVSPSNILSPTSMILPSGMPPEAEVLPTPGPDITAEKSTQGGGRFIAFYPREIHVGIYSEKEGDISGIYEHKSVKQNGITEIYGKSKSRVRWRNSVTYVGTNDVEEIADYFFRNGYNCVDWRLKFYSIKKLLALNFIQAVLFDLNDQMDTNFGTKIDKNEKGHDRNAKAGAKIYTKNSSNLIYSQEYTEFNNPANSANSFETMNPMKANNTQNIRSSKYAGNTICTGKMIQYFQEFFNCSIEGWETHSEADETALLRLY